jgi:acetyltransferase-like isoleucine patch superfamily enzyme
MQSRTFEIFRFLFRKLNAFLWKFRGLYWTIVIQACGGSVGRNLTTGAHVRFKHSPGSNITIGNNVVIGPNVTIDCHSHAQLKIGNDVKFTGGNVLAAYVGLEFGNDTLVGEYACFHDADHVTGENLVTREQPLVASPIQIGTNVWIGCHSTILRGVCISDSSVVAAGSTVLANKYPKNALLAGTPASVKQRALKTK